MDYTLLLYAFSAGMVATINPCGFAMLPAYVSYYLATGEGETVGQSAGTAGSVATIQEFDGTMPRLLRALVVGGTLTAGFLVLFALAGTLISLGAYVLVSLMPWFGLFIGVGLVLLGIWLLLGRHVRVPGLPQPEVGRGRGLRSNFLFGMAYGLVSLSCTLPVFLVVVGSAFTLQGAATSLTQFLAYGLGMGLVLMALTLSLALFEGVLVGHLRRLMPYIERAGALLLLGAGGYIIYYWLTAGQLLRM
ncbi:MAG: cytochrome c biogenesis protein CcdA [Chloroflexi bacterium]|nr:cytochrome c biogenesis protein CcdA [Chloroflexota bacterium]